ncbi:putative DEAD-box RNA helicase [Streptomyces ambofaciens ATCC 23877]|uniref:Putative DEAD-box RNA helicase n=1 Tax=Streptomyces ambofaciens (strain ATCC 23877 / 3486 / DSM 40053 / JCM 4204 / NBRC 12836 / NRRL B-2516) TaxID=278992 RepID=Q1RQZ3_STRA7|nr:DEAD/DEAH box helicase [Streptomyces ambofaciens]AKZ53169.1 putative DEAD-box RNA helicase [Streptomyces ambofaciens ATCC 23877]AKZ60594.1 putative DEAD-box RNA helicase [Streptomyces ambofaciens ATCC 23877]CAI78022.1 putative DEAD-box RNA helicase [Streptomyces ambofaciens ATCC 23877]CAI78296.1 putative DEAD-box RNA helicase [Streptomyces ambofaciens ATCC 23877]CAJ87801.1 putative DEAD-box RNA helicase [Streptomyces ambofaciens ATCC 23877]
MNRTRTNDRFARTRNNGGDSARGNSRFGSPAPRRSGGPSRSAGHGRRPAAMQGEFALPETITPALPSADAFADLDMPRELLAALGSQGVTVPFPIQAATLPNSLAGRDVLGRGRTGSGKTLAFGLALLARTAKRRAEARQPLGLVLVPTRELAQQVTDALTPYARSVKLRLATVVGGMPIGRQASALRGGAEIVVATPGRLKDLITRGDCRLDQVAVTVLDEADQMADMGFMPQVTALLDQVRPEGQRMLFSATLDRNVDLLVRRYLSDPVVHSVDPSAGAVTTMEHHVLHVHGADKHAATTEIAARDGRVLMFLDTKHAVDRLTEHLLNSGVRAAALHGGKSQPQRTRTLTQFKDGHVSVLVATNVAARGIHVDSLDLVVNVDPPTDHKDYLHRGGRTARAGESGSVVTLVTPNQRRGMTRLMATAGIVPQTTQVRAGTEDLHRITGAQAPSGIPVVITAPVAERPKKRGSTSRGRRRPASATRRAAVLPPGAAVAAA